jgi:hypothetical protein
MSTEKPHRRLSLTQPTAPSMSEEPERMSELRAEIEGLQERLCLQEQQLRTQAEHLTRLIEAVERLAIRHVPDPGGNTPRPGHRTRRPSPPRTDRRHHGTGELGPLPEVVIHSPFLALPMERPGPAERGSAHPRMAPGTPADTISVVADPGWEIPEAVGAFGVLTSGE